MRSKRFAAPIGIRFTHSSAAVVMILMLPPISSRASSPHLLERHAFAQADARRGRFRTFLLAACRNFLSDQSAQAQAQKRGGGLAIMSIDQSAAEGRYRVEPVDTLTPDRLFERAWALALLEQVLGQLRHEYTVAGKAALFERLEPTLAGGIDAEPLAAIAAALGATEGAIQVAAHRLRRRYRELIRAEIAATIDDLTEVDDEIRALFGALAT